MSILDYFTPGYTPRDAQASILLDVEKNWKDSDVFIINAPVACHDPEQEVLLFGGKPIKIKDVKIGDLLQGPDGLPRRVLKTHSGKANMVRVIPFRSEPFTITDNHVLSLINTTRIQSNNKRSTVHIKENIMAKDYMELPSSRKLNTRLWRAGQEYDESTLHIPPYILGLWLGDGSSDCPAITTMDSELEISWSNWGRSLGCKTVSYDKGGDNKSYTYRLTTDRGISNKSLDLLRNIEVLDNKHIPLDYLTGSRMQRLELLAGIVDTDGSISKSGRTIEIIQVNERLAKDIRQLCLSLGYSCSISTKVINDKTYYRMHISGTTLREVPVRLSYKTPHNSKSNQNNRRFEIEHVGVGEYFGVTVDRDHLYLMGDYTVTHNSGKSHVGMTIARWANSLKEGHATQIITPTNLLVNQYKQDFPESKVLHKQESYRCTKSDRLTCKQQLLKRNLGHHCLGCHYQKDKRQSRESGGISVSNTWIYQSNKMYKPLLIIDEAHTIVGHVRDNNSKKKWKHKLDYPDNLNTYSKLVEWFQENGYREMMEKMGFDGEPNYLIQVCRERFGRSREWKECLKFLPLDVSSAPPYLWPPSRVQKIVLMSATISMKDVEYLGLDSRRVCMVKCDSPIPAERRPVHLDYVGSLSIANQDENVPRLARRIKEYMRKHPGQKGLVHATYGLANKLREYLSNDDRILFHKQHDKRSKYEKFRRAPESSGMVFIASGLYEGIDLSGDAGRWQVITKIPWPSLGDPVTRHLCEADEEYYTWETLKIVMQACGRICRGPEDFGVTYICDSSYERLRGSRLIPDYFNDSIIRGGTGSE